MARESRSSNSRYRRATDVTLRLPLELKHAVLDHLPQQYVVAIGGVSSAWRLAARSHPDFYVTIHLHLYLNTPELRSLWNTLENAEKACLPVSLSLHIDKDHHSRVSKELLSQFRNVLRHALMNYLVHITVASSTFVPHVIRALNVPAPYLRSLFVEKIVSDFDTNETVISSPLFQDNAPLLRTVRFYNVHISSHIHGMPCFSNVTTAKLAIRSCIGDVHLARWFPSARSISFQMWGPESQREAQSPLTSRRTLDLGNLPRLSTLHIGQTAKFFVLRNMPARIPVLEINGFDEIDPLTYFAHVPGPLSWELSLYISDGEFSREFTYIASAMSSRSSFPGQYSESFTTCEIPDADPGLGAFKFLRTRLHEVVVMNLHQGIMRTALLSWSGSVLASLKYLTITLDDSFHDVLWPPQSHLLFGSHRPVDPSYIETVLPSAIVVPRCPALRYLVIQNPPLSSRWCTVTAGEVYALARALGLRSRSQCALILHNVYWRDPLQLGTLDTLFRKIKIYETQSEWGFERDVDNILFRQLNTPQRRR